MKTRTGTLPATLAACAAGLVFAPAAMAEVTVIADHTTACYACGETANFIIDWTPTGTNTTGMLGVRIDGTDGKTIVTTNAVLVGEALQVRVAATLAQPGFATCRVTEPGAAKSVNWAVAFDPERIRVASPRPADFDAYWDGEVARLAREVPLDAQVVKRTGNVQAGRRVYDVSFATFGGKRVYGIYSVPADATKGPYPLRVNVPGAGPSAGNAMPGDWSAARPDEIYLTLNVHPMPTAATAEQRKADYDAENKALKEKYGTSPYSCAGASVSREEYFYHDIILGLNRAVDWAVAHPHVKKDDVTYMGSSQGGAFGYFLMALNTHFRRGAMLVAAMSDHSAADAGRLPGWPNLIRNQATAEGRAAAAAIAPYYDAAHFAPRITVPVLANVGFVDTTCPPSSVYAAFNALGSKEKQMAHALGLGHNTHGRFYRAFMDWTRIPDGQASREIRAVLLHLGYNMWCDWFPADFDLAQIAKGQPDRKLRLTDDAWRKVTDHLVAKGMNMLVIDLGEGVVYPSHPELAVEGSWSVEKLKAELARLRGLGLEVIPKLNFSACHHGWLKEYSHMVSSPTYYKVVSDLIADVAEIFGHPRFMHIGMDEETAEHQMQTERCQYVVVRKKALWEHDFFFLVRECEKHGMRAWAWGDYCWHNPDFLDRCPKSVLFSNWYYDERNRGFSLEGNHTKDKDIVKTYHLMRDKGFDDIPCGSNYTGWIRKAEGNTGDDVIGRTVHFARTEIPGEHLLGYLMAPWRDLANDENAAWNMKGIDLFADALEGRIPPCQRAGTRQKK